MEKQNNYEIMKRKMQREFASRDLDAVRKEWELESDDAALTLTLLGRQYRIDRRSGAVLWDFNGTSREADYNISMTLFDILTRPRQQASGEMMPISALSTVHTATVPTGSFFDRTAKRFEHRCAALSAACERLGGIPYGRGDVSYLLPVFRDLCVAVRFWDSDEEFGPELSFLCDGNILRFRLPLPEDNFEIIIEYDGTLRGRIMDLTAGEEYTNYRREGAAGYSAGIRQKFVDLLLDIRENCCRNQYFKGEQAQRICEYIYETYDRTPEFLWPNIPSYAAFRMKGTRKWYAIMGSVPRFKLDPASEDQRDVEVINVKVDSGQIKEILSQPGYYPAFHMNKKCWVSIILEDALSDEEIQTRIADSYASI